MERNSHTDDIYANCIRSYLTENRDLRDQVRRANDELMDHKDTISIISQNLASEKQKHDITKSKCQKLENDIYSLEQTNKGIVISANERINLLNNEVKNLMNENNKLKDQIKFYQTDNQQKIQDIKTLEIKLDEKDSTIRILSEQIRSYKSQIEDFQRNEILNRNKLTESQNLYNNYYQKCQKLQLELDRTTKNNQENSIMVSNLQIRISSLENAMKNNKSQETIIMEKNLIIDDLQNQLQKSNLKCQAITDALEHSQDKLRNSMYTEQEASTLKSENIQLKQRISRLEDQIRRYESDLLEKNHQYTESLVKQSRTIDALRKQLSASMTSADYEMMKNEASEARRLANSLGQEYNTIRQTFNTISSKVSNLESTIRATASAPTSPSKNSVYDNDYNDEIDDNFKRNLLSTDYL
ncbi:hypothetical protein TVAG_350200 [Trichomonas vaginalis G3]|uniref:Uncharacterized protein n=1 Tax=Trichomonas vaginalis (strain ATCC PRA-98 / G3) TaxID=412133 RepID=A2F3K1_TRIV3|nr:hypothetical protein TVAGG3_0194160 [Trichomonas vaginalis G3]EAY00524.1 hypothetical protein TVAG_350200 [Trichomonas vaginalis G3]KAI5550185.1 hypothetical protein TVAGG3_0194160 [Trichomonas vaginalis G3]|eukprot:XP_001313453.1 hypothetical protein [Trichomonas vaginalis G3]